MTTLTSTRARGLTERRFHIGVTLLLGAALVFGFSRTFFLRPLFPEAAEFVPPEPFFTLHGIVFTAWFVLLVVQASLVSAGRVDLHRRMGWAGAGLAAVMIPVGLFGALLAAHRTEGFMGVPVPPLQFLVVPLTALVLFALFVGLAIARRHDSQSHKRYMLLASISILGAAVARWPLAFMAAPSPVPLFTVADLTLDLFLVPLLVWDVSARGRPHPVTAWGGLTLVVSAPLGVLLSTTAPWLAFAGWAVGLLD